MQNNTLNLTRYSKEEPYETFICSGRYLCLLIPAYFRTDISSDLYRTGSNTYLLQEKSQFLLIAEEAQFLLIVDGFQFFCYVMNVGSCVLNKFVYYLQKYEIL